jgi:hypothetical protein
MLALTRNPRKRKWHATKDLKAPWQALVISIRVATQAVSADTEMMAVDHTHLPAPREIARQLGGELRGGRIAAPGPGHGRDDRSLSIRLDPAARGGFVVHSFAGDDPLACRDYIRQVLGLTPWAPARWIRPVAAPVPWLEDDSAQRAKIAAAGTIWGDTSDPRNTPVERYLESRGLALDADLIEVVRYHPTLRFEGREHSGMVALFRDIQTNEPCGVHRTFLDRQGRKLSRKMLGRAKGAAIKLDGDEDVTLGLHIGEGVETCLAARQKDRRPVWALGSAGAVAAFPVLPGIEAISLLFEHDERGANERACEACARRWIDAGRDALLIDPQAEDFNTLTMRA